MPKKIGLSHKQSRFVEEYLVDFNATQACIRAGYKERSATVIGHENLRKDYIRQAIEDRIKQLTQSSDVATLEFLGRFKEASGTGRKQVDRKTGVIYFLQADNGLVKIGITTNITRRIATLNTMLPYMMKPLLLIDCDDCCKIEAALHSHFSEKRVRGEWFRLSSEDVEWARLTYGAVK